ncbi:hypothetical protein MGN70_009408 [Eutypa lata]|nr:hypothetical protein MGN70_009408 [Eutypa lata]
MNNNSHEQYSEGQPANNSHEQYSEGQPANNGQNNNGGQPANNGQNNNGQNNNGQNNNGGQPANNGQNNNGGQPANNGQNNNGGQPANNGQNNNGGQPANNGQNNNGQNNNGQNNNGGQPANNGQNNNGGQPANNGQNNNGGQPANNGQNNNGGQPANNGQNNNRGQPANNGQNNNGGQPANNGQNNNGGQPANNGQNNNGGQPANNGQNNNGGQPANNGQDNNGQNNNGQDPGAQTHHNDARMEDADDYEQPFNIRNRHRPDGNNNSRFSRAPSSFPGLGEKYGSETRRQLSEALPAEPVPREQSDNSWQYITIIDPDQKGRKKVLGRIHAILNYMGLIWVWLPSLTKAVQFERAVLVKGSDYNQDKESYLAEAGQLRLGSSSKANLIGCEWQDFMVIGVAVHNKVTLVLGYTIHDMIVMLLPKTALISAFGLENTMGLCNTARALVGQGDIPRGDRKGSSAEMREYQRQQFSAWNGTPPPAEPFPQF